MYKYLILFCFVHLKDDSENANSEFKNIWKACSFFFFQWGETASEICGGPLVTHLEKEDYCRGDK